MFVKRVQEWQVGFTTVEMELAIKVFAGDTLTDEEEDRVTNMLRTLEEQYEKRRVKRHISDGFRRRRASERNDSERINYESAREVCEPRDIYKVPEEAVTNSD